jgi:hypothetical protein
MAIIEHSCEYYVWELRKRSRDWATLKWTEERYQRAVGEAIRQAPLCFWPRDIDTSLTIVEDTRRYALAGLTDIDDPEQVERIWLEGSDDHFYPLSGWFVEDDAGTLTLVMDRTWTEDRVIRMEFRVPHAQLSCSATATGTTGLEEDWLVAKAMTVLLEQADPELADPERTAERLAYYRQRMVELEDLKGSRDEPQKMRTQVW